MYAIIETGGKQYKVQEGDSVRIEKLDLVEGDAVTFDKVLFLSNEDGVSVGKPYLEGVTVDAVVEAQGKAKKIIVFKFKPKIDYRRKQGHRQPYTQIKIEKIVG